MSNPNPIKKFNSQTGRISGKKSGEARRLKKEFRFLLETFLDMPEPNENIFKILEKIGIPKKEITNRLTIAFNLINKAKGNDCRFARLFFELHGDLDQRKEELETPTFRLEFVKNEDNSDTTEATDNES